ncbi:MAG TPA: DUF5681 domain-containing protein [Anaerovoracaceae bacterium]|nr:DUF5681 domain-containing protein [Anaerovoracaceae bacterium]
MGQKKGVSGNPGGRPKGKSNLITTELRQRIKTFLESQFSDLEKSYTKLEPVQKLAFYERLLKFVVPQMTNAEMQIHFEDLSEPQLDEIINRLINKQ